MPRPRVSPVCPVQQPPGRGPAARGRTLTLVLPAAVALASTAATVTSRKQGAGGASVTST
jgi:hypothetical protein